MSSSDIVTVPVEIYTYESMKCTSGTVHSYPGPLTPICVDAFHNR